MQLIEGPADSPFTILLAHGAGAAMDAPAMAAASAALADESFRVVRFEFDYMARRRTENTRKPPPKAELLMGEFREAIASIPVRGRLIIGGKSMGGRVASMIADGEFAAGRIAGLLCLGYPFHPPGKPESLRTAHLERLETPALICQGTRDIFGSREEVAGYTLSNRIEILWLEDGDHDLRPRRAVTGLTAADHMKAMAAAVRSWAGRL